MRVASLPCAVLEIVASDVDRSGAKISVSLPIPNRVQQRRLMKQAGVSTESLRVLWSLGKEIHSHRPPAPTPKRINLNAGPEQASFALHRNSAQDGGPHGDREAKNVLGGSRPNRGRRDSRTNNIRS